MLLPELHAAGAFFCFPPFKQDKEITACTKLRILITKLLELDE